MQLRTGLVWGGQGRGSYRQQWRRQSLRGMRVRACIASVWRVAGAGGGNVGGVRKSGSTVRGAAGGGAQAARAARRLGGARPIGRGSGAIRRLAEYPPRVPTRWHKTRAGTRRYRRFRRSMAKHALPKLSMEWSRPLCTVSIQYLYSTGHHSIFAFWLVAFGHERRRPIIYLRLPPPSIERGVRGN